MQSYSFERMERDIIKLDADYCKKLLPVRENSFSKADCGNILIIAGFSGMIGAAYMSAFAAFRCGSGLVRTLIPESGFSVMQTGLPEAICVNKEDALSQLNRFDAVAIGPGMGVNKVTAELIHKLCSEFDGTIVIDADGLNTLADDKFDLGNTVRAARNVCITPHLGEAAGLMKTSKEELLSRNRCEICRELSDRFESVCLLKGHNTCITGNGERMLVNTSGNAGMATAGAGDVLTGMIVSFAGQGLSAFDAASLAAFLHGSAGDLASKKLGPLSVISRDIIDNISMAIKKL